MTNTKKIAVTGGIGSGKSAVMSILEAEGRFVLSCDAVYKELLTDRNVVIKISDAFDVLPIVLNGKVLLDKGAIARKAFCDKSGTQKLNELTHPLVMREISRRIDDCASEFAYVEVPLLFEGGNARYFDEIIVIARELEARVSSAMTRDNAPREAVMRKLNNQIDYDNYDLTGHIVIHNDSSFEDLKRNVLQVVGEIEKKLG